MRFLRFLVVPALSAALFAQTADTSNGTPAKRHKVHTAAAATKADIDALKEQLAAQQQEIQQLMDQLKQNTQQLQESQQALQQTQSAASQAQSQAAAAQTSAQQNSANVGQLQNQVATLQTDNSDVKKSVADVQKGSENAVVTAHGKLKISGQFFGDYGAYYNTGFGPGFMDTMTNIPGPGNRNYNTFDVTRTYLNFFYSPTDRLTLRITPDIYPQYSGAACSTSTKGETCSATGADKVGKVTGFGSNLDGSLGFRLKYAYLDVNKLFGGNEHFGDDVLTLGQQQNPLMDWEEGLYGYRYVNLVPYNFLGFSSTQVGVSLHGPVKIDGKQYIDYAIGAFNQANFHQFEQAESKQAMARVSFYPFGADSKYQGFGLTGFADYGYKNVAPDTPNAPLYRIAALAHWQSEKNGYGIAGEYDTARNSFSTGNLFSGSAPADEFGGLVSTPTIYGNLDAMAKALLGQNGAFLQDVAVFGHAAIPNTPLTFISMFNYTRPNTNVIHDPLDFYRSVFGLSYKMNDHLRVALDGQNINYVHSQFTFPTAELAKFSSSLAGKNPGGITNAVPNDTGAVFVNTEFTF